MQRSTRRRFVAGSATAGVAAAAGCLGGDDDDGDDDSSGDSDDGDGGSDGPEYEIWAADQGRHVVNVYQPVGDGEFEEVEEIDTAAEDGEVPHMVHFSSDYEYAAIACTAGARTLVYRTEDRELVANLETGTSSHYAGFNPDDDAIIVDVIGESKIVSVDADLEEETFEIGEEIEINESVEGLSETEGAPICHAFDHNGRSIHTLGPSYHDAGVVIVDHENFEIHQTFAHDALPANCGTIPHPTEDKFYLTAGLPRDEEADPEESPLDYRGVGRYYVLDTESYEVIQEEISRGLDAHGFWFADDHSELWLLNRQTNDGAIVNPDNDYVVGEIDEFGPGDNERPDIMWASPDDEYMFVTLRGPNPQSAAHVATGETPGIAVFDIESQERVDILQPAPDDDASDFHGIGVRVMSDEYSQTSPPF